MSIQNLFMFRADLQRDQAAREVVRQRLLAAFRAGAVMTLAEASTLSADELSLTAEARAVVDAEQRLFAAHIQLDPAGAARVAAEAAGQKSVIDSAFERAREQSRKAAQQPATPMPINPLNPTPEFFEGEIGPEA